MECDDDELAEFLKQQQELEAKQAAEKKEAVDGDDGGMKFDDEIEVVNTQPKPR